VHLDAVVGDLRHAARRLAAARGFTLTVAVTLALGIGATTALFSLVDALLLRPLAVREPERLVALYTVSPEGLEPLLAYPDFEEFRRERDVFEGLAAHRRRPLSVRARGASERLWGEEVSATYFDVLGPPMALGRGFDAAASAPQAVLSHDFWRRRFAGSREVLGEPVQVGGLPHVTVGVAGAAFRGTGLELGMGSRTELWIVAAGEDVEGRGTITTNRTARGSRFEVTGRLATGVDVPQAESAARTIAARIAREHPGDNGGSGAALVPAGTPRMSLAARGAVRSFAGVLLAGVGFLLLAACVNVAHMQLARDLARSGEMAVRAALGAGRVRLAGQLLTESALLSLPGLALSVPVALATQHLLMRFSHPFAIPLDYDLRLDGRAFLFAAVLTASAVAGFGLLPALRAARADLRSAFHARGAAAARPRPRLAGTLVGLQVALSVVLLVGAGLFARSLDSAARIDLGFQVDDVVVMNVDFNTDRHRFDEARASRFYGEGLERVRALPGVRAASWAGDVPLGMRKIVIGFFPEPRAAVGDREWQTFFCDVVSDGYFETLGIPVRGREFTPRDGPGTVEVAVVNEAAARRHWPDGDPIGRRFKVRGRTGIKTVEIVGVARDVRQRSFREKPEPRLYFALAQRHFPEMALHARVAGEPTRSIPRIRAELAALEPELPVFTARPMRDQVAAALSQPRMAAALLGAAAAITLALASLGVYGVSVRVAAERRREVGIRVALGALPGDVLRLVLGQALAPIGAGALAGLAAALALGRGLESFLLDVRATDGLTHLASGLVLALVAAVSIYLPSRRLAALDPATVLRQE